MDIHVYGALCLCTDPGYVYTRIVIHLDPNYTLTFTTNLSVIELRIKFVNSVLDLTLLYILLSLALCLCIHALGIIPCIVYYPTRVLLSDRSVIYYPTAVFV